MEIEAEIKQLKERNRRVELDKSWEVSVTRRAFIALITYIFAVIWLYSIDETSIWLKAVIPTVGYILSTITVPHLKKVWTNRKK